MRNTIATSLSVTGIGLHSGSASTVHLRPRDNTEEGWFINGYSIHQTSIISGYLATILQVGEKQISTVEHLFAALYAHRIDDVSIEIIGEEVPILDGSAAPWFRAIAPLPTSGRPQPLVIETPRQFKHGGGILTIEPAPHLSARVNVCFEGYSPESFAGGLEDFEDAMEARTFGYFDALAGLNAHGYAQGATPSNVLALDREGKHVVEQRAKTEQELARHKWLDLVGDLSLVGQPILGAIEVTRGGHQLHHLLVKYLRELAC